MDSPHPDECITVFVFKLIGTGEMLAGVVNNLVDGLGADAYPGEDPVVVVLEMLCGTIATALASADPRDVRRATDLIDQAGARTIEHLRLASELSRRMGQHDRSGRRYG